MLDSITTLDPDIVATPTPVNTALNAASKSEKRGTADGRTLTANGAAPFTAIDIVTGTVVDPVPVPAGDNNVKLASGDANNVPAAIDTDDPSPYKLDFMVMRFLDTSNTAVPSDPNAVFNAVVNVVNVATVDPNTEIGTALPLTVIVAVYVVPPTNAVDPEADNAEKLIYVSAAVVNPVTVEPVIVDENLMDCLPLVPADAGSPEALGPVLLPPMFMVAVPAVAADTLENPVAVPPVNTPPKLITCLPLDGATIGAVPPLSLTTLINIFCSSAE
jgi:hypothetical protein